MAYEAIESEVKVGTMMTIGGFNKKLEKKNPTRLEGFYIGSKTVVDKLKASGESYIHYYQTSKGVVGVWGKTNLDNQMKKAKPGLMTLIEYLGTEKTKSGFDFHKYSVKQDKDNVLQTDEDFGDLGLEQRLSDLDYVTTDEPAVDEVKPTRPVKPSQSPAKITSEHVSAIQARLSRNS